MMWLSSIMCFDHFTTPYVLQLRKLDEPFEGANNVSKSKFLSFSIRSSLLI